MKQKNLDVIMIEAVGQNNCALPYHDLPRHVEASNHDDYALRSEDH